VNRLASIASGRIVFPMPPLEPAIELARERFFTAISRQLQSWLDFFSGDESLSQPAAETLALAHSSDEVGKPLKEFSAQLAEHEFAQIKAWTLDQRRTILAELNSMERLEFLLSDLNGWFAKIPGGNFAPSANQR
jgi:hypothetical protein